MHNDGQILHISKDEWLTTPRSYRGTYHDCFGDHPEWKGRRTLIPPLGKRSGHASTCLLIEGVGFVID